jgi:hypothetical protein
LSSPPGLTGFHPNRTKSDRLSSAGGEPVFPFCGPASVKVFPPEPPVASFGRLQRRAAGKGAKRRSEPLPASTVVVSSTFDGRVGGNTFPLVSFEPRFRTAGPTTAEEQTRRLINLIFAGRNRMVMIRRELPRTKRAGWVRKPFRIEAEEDSPFRGPCAVIGSAVQCGAYAAARFADACCCSAFTAIAQMKPSNSRPSAVMI